jgi:hypothetical protein
MFLKKIASLLSFLLFSLFTPLFALLSALSLILFYDTFCGLFPLFCNLPQNLPYLNVLLYIFFIYGFYSSITERIILYKLPLFIDVQNEDVLHQLENLRITDKNSSVVRKP